MAELGAALNKVLANEKHISGSEKSNGGFSVWGISSAIFPREVKKMAKMTPDAARVFAERLYREKYWKKMRLEELTDQALAAMLLDIGARHGSNTAVRALQKTLNEHGEKIPASGTMDAQTIKAAEKRRGAPGFLNGVKAKLLRLHRQSIENDMDSGKNDENMLERMRGEYQDWVKTRMGNRQEGYSGKR